MTGDAFPARASRKWYLSPFDRALPAGASSRGARRGARASAPRSGRWRAGVRRPSGKQAARALRRFRARRTARAAGGPGTGADAAMPPSLVRNARSSVDTPARISCVPASVGPPTARLVRGLCQRRSPCRRSTARSMASSDVKYTRRSSATACPTTSPPVRQRHARWPSLAFSAYRKLSDAPAKRRSSMGVISRMRAPSALVQAVAPSVSRMARTWPSSRPTQTWSGPATTGADTCAGIRALHTSRPSTHASNTRSPCSVRNTAPAGEMAGTAAAPEPRSRRQASRPDSASIAHAVTPSAPTRCRPEEAGRTVDDAGEVHRVPPVAWSTARTWPSRRTR